MTWIVFACDCGCGFAIPKFEVPEDVSCPSCGSEWDVDETGEGIIDPNIVPLCSGV
ncbi:hypothetical protein JNUCC32_31360 (plasmid) [Paenibacillus sp. JNUCC32]|uniref:hypothetical protein n=1 Tax=Paenibacillus sp. JNUCC32 TaxID=2777984 RepID=UPI001787A560|nr:hypothetical protein [Paenibacillus sp. JNUCC-32]QOT13698.1 hypothetical protein JNUCC32_31360 [Paenibacillus sp. JNUCC-32]